MKRLIGSVRGALMALFLILVLVQSVAGQEVTVAPDVAAEDVAGWETWVAEGEAAMTATAVAAVALPDAPIVINVAGPSSNADETNTIELMGWAGIGVALGLLVYRLVFAKSDAERVEAVHAVQSNRVAMKEMEERFQRASAAEKAAIGTLLDVVEALRGVIPGKADDTLVEWGRDVQTPGAPPS
ncbi:MAG: hypothetical protein SGJ24_18285 [Chloroflexota bacterium]|nr:hypothetical protein [Chloroflexota bacterium]